MTLHVEQDHTDQMRSLYASDPQVVAWTLSNVEMRSALRRLEREDRLVGRGLADAIARTNELWESVDVVRLTGGLKAPSKRLLATHR